MGVLAAILVLALLIIVHELGHFLAARLQGIHVNRFSIGFGPILWKYQGSRTEYALRGIPLGGFVGFPDDEDNSEIPANDPDLLRNRPLLDRAIVISAGVLANLLFAYLILVAQLGIFGVPEGFNYQPGVLVPQVMAENSPAAQAGIRAGDVVIAVENRPLGASESAITDLMTAIQTHVNQPLTLTIERNNQPLLIQVIPQPGADGKGRIGVQLLPHGKPSYRPVKNPLEVINLAATQFQTIVSRTVTGFTQLVTHFQDTVGQVAGPVGIVEQGAKFARNDMASLFTFAAIISINLAILNILPLPALDGGQLVFLIVEGLLGKPLPSKIQDGVMQTGLVLLLGLGVFLIIRDTVQLDSIQNLLQR
ncbi:MAG: RIP metalloprotease RseP [Cyanobacteria bacterium]|nr:RIP metalloprotease RseP [Cyanobacteriota bacterium]MDW8199812.1 RIP metalloprotease RseP [Cyanobacteriota bacterium SKYGB_h_bin112]